MRGRPRHARGRPLVREDARGCRRGGGNSSSRVNSKRGEECLVRAVLTAGLFPKVAAVRNGKRKAKWHTRDDGKVDPHPSSVNYSESQFEYQWMVYNEKVKSTGGIYVRDSTNVSDLALLLFGGQLNASAAAAGGGESGGGGETKVSMLEGYVTFRAPGRTLQLVQTLRAELDAALQRRIDRSVIDHGSSSHHRQEDKEEEEEERKSRALQDAVVSLLRSEDGYGEMQPTFGGCGGRSPPPEVSHSHVLSR